MMMPGMLNCTTVSATALATPAFLMNAASAPPMAVTMMGMAEERRADSTQSFMTFLERHSAPVSTSENRQPARSAASGEPMNLKTFATAVSGNMALMPVFRKMSTSGRTMGAREVPTEGRGLSFEASADLMYSSCGATGSLRVRQYSPAAKMEGIEMMTPHMIASLSGRWSSAAAATGPGVGGTSEAVTSAPMYKAVP